VRKDKRGPGNGDESTWTRIQSAEKETGWTTVVLTGQKTHDSILKVGELWEIKHPYRKGKKYGKKLNSNSVLPVPRITDWFFAAYISKAQLL
jgi:hypothetical protein